MPYKIGHRNLAELTTVSDAARKKSPRAPSIALPEALERALAVYDKERRHATPTEVVANDLGYKSANNGSAIAAIASLRAFGLLEKAQEGKLAIAKDVETYRFAPTEELKSQLRIKWLRSPGVFSQLLDGYTGALPSDATLRFDLIQRGFSPASAETTLGVFKKSVEFARYFEAQSQEVESIEVAGQDDASVRASAVSPPVQVSVPASQEKQHVQPGPSDMDRIPVRLAGGRRAWLEIPTPFYEADKERLIAQIGLVLTEEEQETPNRQ
jgi:hypothetical protein